MWNRLSQVSSFNPFALVQGGEQEESNESQNYLLKEKDELIEGLKAKIRESEEKLAEKVKELEMGKNTLPNMSEDWDRGNSEMYAQIVYKDARILELTNHITEQERTVIDLQETIKEKDEVLKARNKAMQLLKEDLSQRGQVVADQLDDTRTYMREMQESFAAMEAEMKADQVVQREEMQKLQSELDSRSNAIAKLESTVTTLEKAKFDLVTCNADLQTRMVLLQEDKDALIKTLQDEIDRLTAENEDLEQKNWPLEVGEHHTGFEHNEACDIVDHASEILLGSELTEPLRSLRNENLILKETIKNFEEKLASDSSLQDQFNKEKVTLQEEVKELSFLLEQEQVKFNSLDELVSSFSNALLKVSDLSLDPTTIDEIITLVNKGQVYESVSSKLEELKHLENDWNLLMNSMGITSFKDFQEKIKTDSLSIEHLSAQNEKNEFTIEKINEDASFYQSKIEELNTICQKKQTEIDKLALSLLEYKKLEEAQDNLKREVDALNKESKSNAEMYKAKKESCKSKNNQLLEQMEALEKEVANLQCEKNDLLDKFKGLENSSNATDALVLTVNDLKEIHNEMAIIKLNLAEKKDEIDNVNSLMQTCISFLKSFKEDEHLTKENCVLEEKSYENERHILNKPLNDPTKEKKMLLLQSKKISEENLNLKAQLNELAIKFETCTAENQNLKGQKEIMLNIAQDLISFLQLFPPKENFDEIEENKFLFEILIDENTSQKLISSLKKKLIGTFSTINSSIQEIKKELDVHKSRAALFESDCESKKKEIENYTKELENHKKLKINYDFIQKENAALKEKIVSISQEKDCLKTKNNELNRQVEAMNSIKYEWGLRLGELKNALDLVITLKESLDQKINSNLNSFGSELDELLHDMKIAEDEIGLLKQRFAKELNDINIQEIENTNNEKWNELLQNRENWRQEINIGKNTLELLCKDITLINSCFKSKEDHLESEKFKIKKELEEFKHNQALNEEKFNMIICEKESTLSNLKKDLDQAKFEIKEREQYLNGINDLLIEFNEHEATKEFIVEHLHDTCSGSWICDHIESIKKNKKLLEHMLTGYKNVIDNYSLQNENLHYIKSKINALLSNMHPHKIQNFSNKIEEHELIDEVIKYIKNVLNDRKETEEKLKQLKKNNEEIHSVNSTLNESIKHFHQKEQRYLDQLANLQSRLEKLLSKQELIQVELEEKKNELSLVLDSKDAEISNLQKYHTYLAETSNIINNLESERDDLTQKLNSTNEKLNHFSQLYKEKALEVQSYQEKVLALHGILKLKTSEIEKLDHTLTIKNHAFLEFEHSLADTKRHCTELDNAIQLMSKEVVQLNKECKIYLDKNSCLQQEVLTIKSNNEFLEHKIESLQNIECSKHSKILADLELEISKCKNQNKLMCRELENKEAHLQHSLEKIRMLEEKAKSHSLEKSQENINNLVSTSEEDRLKIPIAGGDFYEDSNKIIDDYKTLQQDYFSLESKFFSLKSDFEVNESERNTLLLKIKELESNAKLEHNKFQQNSSFVIEKHLKDEIKEVTKQLTMQKLKNSKILLKLKAFKDETEVLKEKLDKSVDKEKFEMKVEEIDHLSKFLYEKEQFISSLQKQIEHSNSHNQYEIDNLNRKIAELMTLNEVFKEKIESYKKSLLDQEQKQQNILTFYKEEAAEKETLLLQLEKLKGEREKLQEKILDMTNQAKCLENENMKLKHSVQGSEEHIKMLTHDNHSYQEVLESLSTAKCNLEGELKKLLLSKREEFIKEKEELIENLKEQVKSFQNDEKMLKMQTLALEEENKRIATDLRQKSNLFTELENEIALLRQKIKVLEESSSSQNDESLISSPIYELRNELQTIKDSNISLNSQITQLKNDFDEKSTILNRALKENAELSTELSDLMSHENDLRENWMTQQQKWTFDSSQMHLLESSLRQALADQSNELQNMKVALEAQLTEKEELKKALEQTRGQQSCLRPNQSSQHANGHHYTNNTPLCTFYQQSMQTDIPSVILSEENSVQRENKDSLLEAPAMDQSLLLPYHLDQQLSYQELAQALVREQQKREALEAELQRRLEAKQNDSKTGPHDISKTSSECHVLIDNEPSKSQEPSISFGKLLCSPSASRLFWWQKGRRLDQLVRRWINPQKLIWLYMAAIHLCLIVYLF